MIKRSATVGLVCMLWAAEGAAVAAETLQTAEVETLALAEEPGHEAMLSRAGALTDLSIARSQLPDPSLRLGLANFPIESGGFGTEGRTQAQLGLRQAFPPGDTLSLRRQEFELLHCQQCYRRNMKL